MFNDECSCRAGVISRARGEIHDRLQLPGVRRQRVISDSVDVQRVRSTVRIHRSLSQCQSSTTAGLETHERHYRLPACLSTPTCSNRPRFTSATRGQYELIELLL